MSLPFFVLSSLVPAGYVCLWTNTKRGGRPASARPGQVVGGRKKYITHDPTNNQRPTCVHKDTGHGRRGDRGPRPRSQLDVLSRYIKGKAQAPGGGRRARRVSHPHPSTRTGASCAARRRPMCLPGSCGARGSRSALAHPRSHYR
jgi:hypothetical protein